MTDVEFFWDPVCPWAWLTSRWVTEVARQRDLTVDWRFICLKLVNAAKDNGQDFAEGYVGVHTSGQKLLRVAASVRESEGHEAVGPLYTQFGGDARAARRKELTEHCEGVPDYPVGRPRRHSTRPTTTRDSCCRPRPTRR